MPVGAQGAMLPFLHRAFADVLNGVQDRTILFAGDSHSYGFQSAIGPFSQVYYTTMIKYLNAAGITPVQQGLVIPTPAAAQADGRWAYVSGWGTLGTPVGNGFGFGGMNNGIPSNSFAAVIASTALNTAGLTYHPGTNCDTFDVYYADNPANGTFQINIDGGANTTVAPGAIGVKKVTIAGAVSATHTLNFNVTVQALGCYILGVDARLSTTPTLRLGNAGVNGASAQSWNNTQNNGPLQAIGVYAPDVTIIALGGNDIILNVPQTVNSVINSLTAIANAAKVSGDVIIGGLVPQSLTQFGFNPNPALANLNAIIQQFAFANDYGFIDFAGAWGGLGSQQFSQLQALGFYDAQGIEFPNRGQADRAKVTVNALMSL